MLDNDRLVEKTLRKEYLDVGNGHQIYFETFGNPEGINVLFLHGGPGMGFSDFDKRFFDPNVFHVVFFDQRGASRSKPLGCIEHNNTQMLLEDMEKLLDHLGIEKTILFGGSWGSTLSLLFGIKHPSRVSAMILRGVFPATRKSIRFFEEGGAAPFFPQAWNRLRSMVPAEENHKLSDYYFRMMQSSDQEIRKKYAYELALYGAVIGTKGATIQEVEQMLASMDFESKSMIQIHYSKNYFFLPDNYISENLDKIEDISIHIVQGRYDMICPPVYAIEIHERLKNSRLHLLDAGHSSTEPAIHNQLKASLRELIE